MVPGFSLSHRIAGLAIFGDVGALATLVTGMVITTLMTGTAAIS